MEDDDILDYISRQNRESYNDGLREAHRRLAAWIDEAGGHNLSREDLDRILPEVEDENR